MWKIGDIKIKNHVVLGPMAGITFLSYRRFMKPFGVGLSVTEMVSDCGLIYNNEATLDYIKTSNDDHPVAIQLFGSDEDKICQAIDIVIAHNPNFEFIDINLGCPVNKVTKTGAGSAMLKDTARLETFMRAIVEYSPKPVTAKIRLGWDDNSINVLENVKALERAGVKAIAIHARTAKQMYGGKANYEAIKDLGANMSIPLIISGDIFSLDDAIKAMDITKATAAMVARGAVGNPTLVSQINQYIENKEIIENVSLENNIKYLLKFTDMIIEEKGEYKAMMIMRGLAPRFFNNYPNTKKIKATLTENLTTKASLYKFLDDFNEFKHN